MRDGQIIAGETAAGEKVDINVDEGGAISVNVQDQTTTIVEFFAREILNTVTLAANAVAEAKTITLSPGHNVVTGDVIVLKEGSAFFQAKVTNVATNVITLDSPIDFAFTTAAIGQRCNINMNVNGSVTPRIFFISPVNLTVDVDITAVTFHIDDNAAMDTTTFWGIPKLANGVVLRRKDGVLKNIFNVKSNGDFAHHCDAPEFYSKIGGGEYSIVAKKRFSGQHNNGVALRLLSASADELQVIIQDDLTGLAEFHAIMQGHVLLP